MLTIFSCPKPFTDPHINIIQRNAIKSWTLLRPRPEIILIGDEEGTAEICEELGLRHIPEVERNEYGTPLVSSIFEIGQSEATNSLLCYVNADIILMSDFINAVQKVIAQMGEQKFLLVSRRWNIELKERWNFEQSNWESELRSYVMKHGKLDRPSAIDYFIFPKGLWKKIPPFALGRLRWDNWLISYPLSLKIPVIDLSARNMAVHQRHNYAYLTAKRFKVEVDQEKSYNENLIGPRWPLRAYTTWDATHILTTSGIRETAVWRKLDSSLERLIGYVGFRLRNFHPYSYPLFILGKGLKTITNYIREAIYKRNF